MNKERTIPFIQELFELCCAEQFQQYECEIDLATEGEVELTHSSIATIEAGSQDLEITVSMHLSYNVLLLTYPSSDVNIEDSILDDWTSEFANQLLGRVKHKLLEYQCNLNMGLPECAHDEELDTFIPETGITKIYAFDIDNEIFKCAITIELFNKDLELKKSEGSETLQEGEMAFF